MDRESVYMQYICELDIHGLRNLPVEASKLIENKDQFQTTQEVTTFSSGEQISNDDTKKCKKLNKTSTNFKL